MPAQAAYQKATFAGGCFWCMQPVFDAAQGVISTEVGYTGGEERDADYESVSGGNTAHIEAIQVTYDPTRIDYKSLLALYWENIDPFDAQGQFADKGKQYHTVIYYRSPDEKRAAEASKAELQSRFSDKPVATRIEAAMPFYAAETYHQDYYKKNSLRYNLYKHGSGRVARLKELWGK